MMINIILRSRLVLSFFMISFPLITILSQDRFAKVEITTEQLSENIYMLQGSGGNIGVVVGDDGVFMIDDQYAPLSEKIQAAISKLSDHPVKFLVNTHWHGDHTGGNENFAQKGAVIIAHKNVRQRMSTEQVMKAFSRTVPPSPKDAWPVITFAEDLSLYLNGEDIFAFHVHNAHTDGDIIIYFPKSNIIHMGDTYFKGRYPFIDISSGGSVDGVINGLNKVLMLIDEETKIIPGHGAVASKSDMVQTRDMLMTLRDRVKSAIQSGMTFDEIKAANISKEYDEAWGGGFINSERIVSIIYSDLSRGSAEEKE